jgi:DNA-binding response OmpR family regulator
MSPMQTKHILIVDDDRRIAHLIAELLKSRQYQVDLAYTGAEALEKVCHRPDIVLLDRKLPDMEGLDICRKIREDKRFRGIPIVILSGRDSIPDKIEGLYFGADDYMTKPFDNEELIARLEAVLRRTHFSEYLSEEKETLIDEVRRIIQHQLISPYFQPIFS